MPIQIMCWNMERITANNCTGKVKSMVEAIGKTAKGNQPWALAVLECKDNGMAVATQLQHSLHGAGIEIIEANGKGSTKENVVLIYGGGCTFQGGAAHQEWHGAFTEKMQAETANFVNLQFAAASSPNARALRERQADGYGRDATMLKAMDGQWKAENCRDPVLVKLSADGEAFSIAFVHSPGPGAKAQMSEAISYAKTYFKCITKSLADAGAEVVMGDFNIYGSDDIQTHQDWSLKEVADAVAGPGTTFKITGDRSSSQLDRVFMHSKYVFGSKVTLMDAKVDASDHLGLYANIATDVASNGQWPAAAAAAAAAGAPASQAAAPAEAAVGMEE